MWKSKILRARFIIRFGYGVLGLAWAFAIAGNVQAIILWLNLRRLDKML